MSKFKETLFGVYNLKEIRVKEAKIPKVIHRIWVGGEIETATFVNLKEFQEKLNDVQMDRKEKYEHILWTTQSTKDNKAAGEQMRILEKQGMKICFMEDKFDQSNIGRATQAEIKKLMGKKQYKFVSDLWRMYILYVMGGIYMDADIGIGQETFEEELYHRYQLKGDEYSYMPLLGSAFPFSVCEEEFQEGGLCSYFEKEKGKYRSGYAWNYFYATKAENNAILNALIHLLYEKRDAQTVAVEMINLFYQDIGGMQDGEALFRYAFAPLHLQYATTASTKKEQ